MISKETIWHLTCKYCKGFWSIASMDDWKPKELYCTHCGKKCVIELVDTTNIFCPYNPDSIKKQRWEV